LTLSLKAMDNWYRTSLNGDGKTPVFQSRKGSPAMRLFAIKSLRQRLIFFLLIPAALLLSLMGFFGFVYAKKIMLNQWQETAIAKLRWAAHNIDMRVSRPVEWIEMFHKTAGGRGEYTLQRWILDRLRETEGVTAVRLEWLGKTPGKSMMGGMDSQGDHHGMMHFHHARIAEVTPPRYDTETGQETVSLVSVLKDRSEKAVGRLEVVVRFDYLMEDIMKIGWWQSDTACLVDESGTCLADAEPLIQTLRDAAAVGDSPRFRDQCHALRSSSANIGARLLHQQCQKLGGISGEALLRDGNGHVADLAEELESFRRSIQGYLTGRGDRTRRLI